MNESEENKRKESINRNKINFAKGLVGIGAGIVGNMVESTQIGVDSWELEDCDDIEDIRKVHREHLIFVKIRCSPYLCIFKPHLLGSNLLLSASHRHHSVNRKIG